MEHPRLLPKLRAALTCLYDDGSHPHHRHEAHEFLLSFKGSNLRRAVVSRVKSQRDRGSNNDGTASIGDIANNPIDEDVGGSIYLSCLALLLQSFNGQNVSHESIFAAQTLNHRCRSIKLAETLDIEAEDGVECGMAKLVLAWEEVKSERAMLTSGAGNPDAINGLGEKSKMILDAWVERYVPMIANSCCSGSHAQDSICDGAELLSQVLQRHSSSLLGSANNTDGEKREEEIKGTLIMLTLAVAMYTASFCATVEEHQHQQMQQHSAARPAWANSVLADLGAALSVTALRIKYRPLPDKHATPQPESSCPPLIDMLVNTTKMVGESAESYLSQKVQQPQSHDMMLTAHTHAMQQSVAACMKSLPETVLLPAGHDTGHRIPSIDRACLRAASMELRSAGSGMGKAWKVTIGASSNGQSQDSSATQLLECCEAWARYVAVPLDLVNTTVGSLAVEYLHVSRDTLHSSQTQKAQTAAFQYLVSIFDSASPSLTAEDILTAALGVGASGHTGKRGGGAARKNANTKKKQGNKSKKRHEKRLGRAVAVQDGEGGGSADAAEQELLARRNAACVAAAAVFGVSLADASSMDDTWGLRPAALSPSTTTHGICSTVASAISSVLPHLLYQERQEGESNPPWRLELFRVLAGSLRQICAASTREIRALAYEPLMILHTSLNSVAHITLKVEQVAVEIICECTQVLATSCGYPPGYFTCLTENNDEELEIERNDIRDVARSVCSLDAGDIRTQGGQKSPSILILERIVTACNAATQQSDLPPETVVHILSALAKPLNKLGKICSSNQPSVPGCAIMVSTLQALGTVCDRLNASFDTRSVSEILPLSRLALMGAASLTPMFGNIADAMNRPAVIDKERELFATFERTLLSSLQHSMLSTARMPELAAASTLSTTRYDIKGAMRGPGGEDHVGCIALLRFSSESDRLTSSVFRVYGPSLLDDLSSLYNGLKASELERGVGCDHGIGVTPISRRLILRVVSRLALHGANEKGSIILQQLVHAPIVEMRSQRELAFSAEKLFRLCEAAYDLSFFSPDLVADLFDTASDDLEIVFESVVTGYSMILFASDGDAACQQWGRLRGAAHSVLSACLKSAISGYSAKIISALIKAECDAAIGQCNQGSESGSNLFIDAIVGDEMVPAGVYIMLIKDCLKRLGKRKDQAEKCMAESQTCLSLLQDVAPSILPLLLHQSPEASAHVDPRPTIAEAWFLALESLVLVCRNSEQITASLVDHEMTTFLGDSLSVAMALIFLKDVGTKHSAAPDLQNGMSLDGPQTLALERFVTASLLLCPDVLVAGGKNVATLIQVQGVQGQGYEGAVILIAAILRGISGAVPPWLVEEAPDLIRALYTCVGCDCDQFMLILDASTKIRASAPFGGVRAGELLAGRYLDCSNHHLTQFLSKSKDVCTKGDWRRLKVVLKAACGGKKKDAGFNLKPQYTSWECDRL